MTSKALAKARQGKPRSARGQKDGRLFIAAAKPDPEVLRSAIRTWIVPVLVRQFLDEQGPAGRPNEANTEKGTTKPLGKEDADVNRIY